MAKSHPHSIPKTGIPGLIQNWKYDLIAGFSVAMVALPLSLGIATASDLPPITGVLTAILAGLITTFVRSSHVSINGPSPALIIVVLSATEALGGFKYVTAAIIVAGALQVLFGFLKLGKIGQLFPAAVIQGVLAGIGVIILVTQFDEALGFTYDPQDKTILQKILSLPRHIFTPGTGIQFNPYLAFITALGGGFLVSYRYIKTKFIKFIPAPMWVLVISIPFVFIWNFMEPGYFPAIGNLVLEKDPARLLVQLPNNIMDGVLFPDFSQIGHPGFWTAVISILLIASIETLASAKAVDRLDPFKRKTDLNKELRGVGISTMIAGAIGALPILTVIVRSSVNIYNDGKTKWSNFFHGLIILMFVLIFTPVIQKIPMAALAAILIYSGYKLASIDVFRHAYQSGWEQLAILLFTMFAVVASNLLAGIFLGILFTLMIQYSRSHESFTDFISHLFSKAFKPVKTKEKRVKIQARGGLNFLKLLQVEKILESLDIHSRATLDFSKAKWIDYTMLEYIFEFVKEFRRKGGNFILKGLEKHQSSVNHPYALKVLPKDTTPRLTTRELRLKHYAEINRWTYRHEMEWDTSYLQNFWFFETRPIEYKKNVIKGDHHKLGDHFEISDLYFHEGEMMAKKEFKSTVEVVHLPFEVPIFTLEKEGVFDKFFDKFRSFTGYEDIDFKLFPDFSDKYLLESPDPDSIRKFFSPDLIRFFEEHEIYHIESNGQALLIFRRFQLSTLEEVEDMISFCTEMVEVLVAMRRAPEKEKNS